MQDSCGRRCVPGDGGAVRDRGSLLRHFRLEIADQGAVGVRRAGPELRPYAWGRARPTRKFLRAFMKEPRLAPVMQTPQVFLAAATSLSWGEASGAWQATELPAATYREAIAALVRDCHRR